jgi:hypothetical protein
MEELINRLKEKYAEYKYSSDFIDNCFKTFTDAGFKTKIITSFIYNHFSNRIIENRSCTQHKLIFLYNLHLRNSTIQIQDCLYKSYMLSSTNASKYRMILMEYKL